MRIGLSRVAALAAVALLVSACGGDREVPTPDLVLPAGAAVPGGLRTEPVADLAPLRALADGDGLVAVTRCEPSGISLPDGAVLRWRLPESRTPGERLAIVVADPAARAWLDTGETATVEASGTRASGVVRHFTDIGLSTKRPARRDPAARAPTGGAASGPDDRRDPTARVAGGNVSHVVVGRTKVVERAKLKRVADAYKRLVGEAGVSKPMTREMMRTLYGEGDFATVKSLLESGVIAKEHGLAMADLRSAMILEVTARIAKENGWRIVRSDSGNQSSGMKSDVDQTIYVYEPDGKGGWRRTEVGDQKFIDAFRTRFPKEAGISLEALDVATIAGRDKYPDVRRTSLQLDAEGGRAFSEHAAETMVALRLTPGAYTYCGAVVQQMQLRADAAIEAMLREGGSAPKGVREAHPELASMLGPNGLNNLVCLEIAPDGQGAWGPRELSKEAARRVMFDGLPPSLRAGHAYDAAVANYLEFMHHLHDRHPAVKYALRALDDGIRTLHEFRTGEKLPEYASVPPEQRRAHLEKLFGHDPAMSKAIDRWKTALDVSAQLRDAHKGGQLTDDVYQRALRPLAEELAKARGGTPESSMAAARREYDARCQEFLARNAVATATTRLFEYVTGDPKDPRTQTRVLSEVDEAPLRAALGLEGEAKAAAWERVKAEIVRNEADLARLQLLYSFREMRADVAKEILERAKAQGLAPVEVERMNALYAESRETFFGLKRYREFPDLYHAYWKAAGRLAVEHTVRTMQESLLVQSGVIDTDGGRGVVALFTKNRAAGITARYLRNAVFDVGNVAGVMQVLRKWSESGGDPDATAQEAVVQAVSVLPVVGQIYTLASSETVGQAALTGGVMITCVVVPQAGIAALMFSVGEAGVAIYESEIVRPLQDTAADAIYRGFVGPSTRAYDTVPAQFTDDDAKRLKSAEAGVYEWEGGTDPSSRERARAFAAERDVLRTKRALWQGYDTERRRKPEWEKLGITSQVAFEGPTLLDGVEPVVLYTPSREGPVDFDAVPLTGAEEARRVELARRKDALEVEGVSFQEELAEYADLEDRKLAAERAAAARVRVAAAPEMRHQVRVDSVWPWLEKKTKDRSMLDARAYAASFCRDHRDAIVAGLKKAGVLGPSATEVPSTAVEELGTRFLDDLTRSRERWRAWRLVVDAQKKAEADRLERRKGAWFAEALAKVATTPPETLLSEATRGVLATVGASAELAASLSPLASAIEERHVPLSPPEVEFSLRKVAVDPDAKARPGAGSPANGGGSNEGGDAERKEEYEFRVDVKVTADPTIYKGRWHAASYQLDPESARTAASSGSYKGLPLDEATRKSLLEHAQRAGPQDADRKGVDPILLAFAFCDAVEIPPRVVPETVASLPRLVKVKIPGQDVEAYLFGGATVAPEPGRALEGALEIRAALAKNGDTTVVVTSKAMAKLDSRQPDLGIRLTLLRATEKEGPFEKVTSIDLFGDRAMWSGSDTAVEKGRVEGVDDDGKHALLFDVALRGAAKKFGRRTVWYVVRQVPISGLKSNRENRKILGPEEPSNVVGPGEVALRVLNEKDKDGRLRSSGSRSEEFGLYVRFGYEDQAYEIWGAEIRLETPFGTRRVWTPRIEDGTRIGYVDHDSARVTAAVVLRPEGGTVTLNATGEGHAATAEVAIPPDPELVKAAAQRVESAKDDAQRRNKDEAASSANARKTLAALKDPRGSPPTGGDPSLDLANWVPEVVQFVQTRLQARLQIEFMEPLFRARGARWSAIQAFDFAAAVRASRDVAKAAKAADDVYAEYRRDLAAAVALWDRAKPFNDYYAERIKNDKSAVATLEQSADADSRRRRREGWEQVAQDAWFAGDAASVDEAVRELATTYEGPKENVLYAGVLRNYAPRVASLTGDRARAAEMWRNALELQLAAPDMTPEYRASLERSFRTEIPTWWPEGALPK